MTFSKILFAATLSLSLLGTVSAQRAEDVLATSKDISYNASSLSPQGQKFYFEQRRMLSETRTALLDEMISESILEAESKVQNTTVDKLLQTQRAKVPEPTAAQILSTYNANRAAMGDRTLEQARKDLVEFLKRDDEDKAVAAYLEELRTKHKVVKGKDVNALGLTPTDVLVTIAGRPITMGDFLQANRVRLNDTEAQIYEQVRSDLQATIFSTLATQEAKARGIDTSDLIATEITNKMRDFSDEEREVLESDLMRRLFAKYDVKFTLAEPTRIVQNISVDDDPSSGKIDAPVTVVMFTDFQCPVCARTHPLLKQAVAAYGDKVRFVIRDFPLEKIHENSFIAALAANAARAQGKFAEYTDVLYKNQQALDKLSLIKYAMELGLNAKQFELDFTDAKTAAEVRKDLADGRSYGVGGTPTIYVNGVKVQRLSLTAFRSAIDRALSK